MVTIVSGLNVLLRDRLPSDADRWVYWLDHGEWGDYDAPWEEMGGQPLTDQRKAELRARFLRSCEEEHPSARTRAVIAMPDGRPLGWVNLYRKEDAPGRLYVGIDICEDAYLNRGLGTEALTLWVDYQFAHTDVPAIRLETWSFNPRMMRVAQKVGFRLEGVEPGTMEWQGEWLDLITFRVLRGEWPCATE